MTKNKNICRQATCWVISAVVLFVFSGTAQATHLESQIRSLKQTVDAQKGKVSQLRSQGDTLKNQLAIINGQIEATTTELSLTSAKYEETTHNIEAAKADIEQNKLILADNLRLMYQESNVSTLEMLVASKTLSEFVNRQQYLEKVKASVSDALDSIEALKKQLELQQQELAGLITQQKALEYGLSQQRSQSASLLVQTQGQEAAYQAQLAASKRQLSQLESQQAAEIAARSRSSAYYGNGNYPWANAQPFPNSTPDPWGFYLRQCTSYAAWKRANIGRPIPAWGYMGRANAKDWIGWAQNSGMRVDRTPEVGAIGVYTGGPYGHVMIVSAISGNSVLVTQYNANFQGTYSESFWNISDLYFIH